MVTYKRSQRLRAKKPKKVLEDEGVLDTEEKLWWKMVPEEEWRKFKPTVTWSSQRFQQEVRVKECKRFKLKSQSVEKKDNDEKVTLGRTELSEGEEGDVMGGESEEEDCESQMDDSDSDHDESDQDGMTGGIKEEGQLFSVHECPDTGFNGHSENKSGGGKLSHSKSKVATSGVELATQSQRPIRKDLKMSYSCSRIKRGLKLIIRKQ